MLAAMGTQDQHRLNSNCMHCLIMLINRLADFAGYDMDNVLRIGGESTQSEKDNLGQP